MNDASPETPPTDTGTPPPPAPPPGWIERGLEHLQDLGFSPSVAERFVSWWRRYGLVKTLILTVAVLWPVLRFQVLPHATSSFIEAVAEGEGLQLSVTDWSLSLTDFSATAHDVVIRTNGRYRQPFLIRAETIEVDASLWQNIGDGIGRWRRRVANAGRFVVGADIVPLAPRAVGRSITITEGELYLERLISGRGNWQDASVRTTAPGAVERDSVEPYYVPLIEVHDLTVTYVEHLPAPAESGLEQSLTSTFHLDEATLTLGDFVGPVDQRDDPTDFSIDGRVADGRLSITGVFNLWAPSFAFDISVSNVGAATLGLLSPEASVVPSSGTMTGHVQVAVKDDTMRQCAVNVTFTDVRYRPNPRSPIVAPRRASLGRQLQNVVISDVVETLCLGDWSDPQFRPLWAVHASMTSAALHDAPTTVQAVADFDRKRFGESLTPEGVKTELGKSADEFTQEVGRQIGEQTGTAVSRGLKSVGRGIGRLFGRKPK